MWPDVFNVLSMVNNDSTIDMINDFGRCNFVCGVHEEKVIFDEICRIANFDRVCDWP